MITKRTNGQTLIYNTLHKKTQVYQRKPQQKPNYEGNAAVTRYDYNLTMMNSPKPATDTIYPHIKF